jgi:hypothetical protein
MAYARSAIAPRNLAFQQIPARTGPATARARPGLFRRLLAAMMAARARQVDREIARYLSGTGGKFTDEAEREIERRYLNNQSGW